MMLYHSELIEAASSPLFINNRKLNIKMNSLLSRALELQHAAHELMYLGMDGEPVYSDTFCRLNKEVLVKSDSLFSAQSSDVEEEANLCLALLMGYNATIYE